MPDQPLKIMWHGAQANAAEKSISERFYGPWAQGVNRCGDRHQRMPIADFRGDVVADVACCWGVSGGVRKVVDAYHGAGKHVIIYDKGMLRAKNKSDYHRVQIDDGNPLKCMMRRGRSDERLDQRSIKAKIKKLGRRTKSSKSAPIVIATNSQKHNDFWGIEDGAAYDRQIVDEIRKHTDRPIIYRPKPKRSAFLPIPGTTYSTRPENIEQILKGAHVLVTHSSNCAINAILMDVPVICLGQCAATPVSGTSLDTIEDPFYPDAALLRWWMVCLMWFEWTNKELESGEAWKFIRSEMKRVRV